MDGAARGDLRQARAPLVAEVAAEEQFQLDAGNLALGRVAREPLLDPVELPALAFDEQGNWQRGGAQRPPGKFAESLTLPLTPYGRRWDSLGPVLGEKSESL